MTSVKSSKRPTVLFVGKRVGAFRTARRLNLGVLVLAEAPPNRTEHDVVEAFFPCDFSDPATDWAALAAQIGSGQAISAVFALAERTVLPAATMRQVLNLPGLNVQAAQRCTNKVRMKKAIRAKGLRSAEFISTDARLSREEYLDRLGLPLVLKPGSGSGGRGTRVFFREEDVPAVFPRGWLLEGFIHGVEMSVESLVADGRPIFTNFTEYLQPGWANVVPAQLTPEIAASVRAVNAAAIRALDIPSGITHLEIFLTPAGVVFGELAARPPGGYIMELVEHAYGFDLWQAWFELELGKTPQVPEQAPASAGVLILHPGRGRVVGLSGREQAQQIVGVKRVSSRVQLGDEVGDRQGVGQEVGHILVRGPTRAEVVASLTAARQLIQIEVEA